MEETFFAADIDENIHTIDLHHTSTVHQALEQLERELFFCHQKQTPYLRVIHGIGKGILANAVHQALDKNPLIAAHKCNGGHCIAIL